MGRHRIHADDAAKSRAYRVRVAEERAAKVSVARQVVRFS